MFARTRILFFSSALLFLAACGSGDTSIDGNVTVPSSESVNSSVSSSAAVSSEASSKEPAQARVITIGAVKWAFTPSAITVKKGEKITLRLTSTDGRHGFAIPDLGINQDMPEGQIVSLDLPTDRAGTFAFRCSVPCGEGHREMTGTISIE